jgi:type II secretion system protein J
MSKAFTLIEVVLALLIGSFIAVIAFGALKGVSTSSKRLNSHIESSSEINYICDKIKQDLNNLFKDKKAENRKFVCELVETEGMPSSRLLFYTVSCNKARKLEPEGDVYEVEYRLIENEDGQTLFVRRLWPNPDKENQPGGVMTVLARNVKAFSVKCHDGTEWLTQWPEENDKLPALVEISVLATVGDSDKILTESVIINLLRNQGDQAILDSTEEETQQESDYKDSETQQ